MPQLLFRNIGNILEEIIIEKDKSYFEQNYQSQRADYLEDKALEYFKRLLPTASIYSNLHYEIEEDGINKKVETDGIVLYDYNLFIIECKSGNLSLSAKRGGIERIKKNVTDLIDSAYSQALRTKQYIESTVQPTFEYEDGSEAITIKNKNKIDNIFLVNVTLENLGNLATNLNSLKNIKLLQGKEWPWSVFINDLRVISEIIESPSEFLTFLKRRIRANDFPQFETADELDFLMFYLNEGLYFEDVTKKNKSPFMPFAYTEALDRYYDFIGGRVSSGEKPKLRTNQAFKNLVRSIESLGKEGFTRVTTSLLGFSSESHDKIMEGIKHAKDLSDKDGRPHDATFYFKADSLGVTFFVCQNSGASELERMEDHCKLKMYQTKYEKWIAVIIESASGITIPYDFLSYQKKWEHDEQMEQKLNNFKQSKWSQLDSNDKKVGRNEPCPCGSGLKFKKCCRK